MADRDGALGVVAERQARHAENRGLFLHAARVCEHRLGALDQWRRTLTGRLFATKGGWRRLVVAAYRARLLDATRDFRAFHRMLLDQGLAVRAGEPLLPPQGAVPDDLPIVAARIRALMRAGVERAPGQSLA